MIYAIVALAALAGVAAWLLWRCLALRGALKQARAQCQSLQRDRAIRQNLQHMLDRREAEIRRLRARAADYEKNFQDLEDRASDLNMSLFRESGLRILAEKEDGAKRLKMEQLERQLEDAQGRLKRRDAEAKSLEAALRTRDEEARRTEATLQDVITAQEAELSRLRANAARRAARKARQESANPDQVTLEELLDTAPAPSFSPKTD